MPVNHNKNRQTKNIEIGLNDSSVENNLQSDNAYNNQGLENARKLEQSLKKEK